MKRQKYSKSVFRSIKFVQLVSIGVAMAGVAVIGSYLFLNARAEDGVPVGRGEAVFNVSCPFTRANNDDPIVYPGKVGAAHRHDFYGNKTTDAFSTTDSLMAGETSCDDDGDTASYWQPSMGKRNSDGTIEWIEPSKTTVYYEYGGTDDTPQVSQYPIGLRMIAGDATNTEDTSNRITYWECVLRGDGERQDLEPRQTRIPESCPPDYLIVGTAEFPDCWDGIWLYPPNPKEYQHMVYSGGTPERGPDCPASHPVKLPQVQMRIHYRIGGAPGLFLSSDLSTPRGENNHGRSLHGDFWNAWQPGRLKKMIAFCLNRGEGCQINPQNPNDQRPPDPPGTLPPPYPEGDEPPAPVLGDANSDRRVNAFDASIFTRYRGQSYPLADFNDDGIVNARDFEILQNEWTW